MTYRLVSREAWGAVPPTSHKLLAVPPAGVAVHWEGPSLGTPSPDRCDDLVRSIQRHHMGARGWSDIAYSFVVCPHGTVFVGRGWGVRTAANGTAAGNDAWHAVCYLGGAGDPFTTAAQDAIVALVAEQRRIWPTATGVRPHSAFRPTACPGDTIRAWLATDPFRAPAPSPPATPPVDYPEDAMKRHFLRTPPLDPQGRARLDLPIPAARIVSIEANGSDGLARIPKFAPYARGDGSRVQVEDGTAGIAYDFIVWETTA